MSQKILGIDIGSYSVKAVRLKSKLGGGLEYIDSFYEPIVFDSEDYDSSVVKAISKLIRENGLGNDAILTAVPAQRVSGRFLQLPLTDRKKIDQVIGFEIENYMPFSAENIVTDYQFISKEKAGSTIFVQVVQKSDIKSILHIFEQVGVEIKHLDSEALALSSVLSQTFKDGEPHAIVDVGHSKTLLTIINKGKVASAHSIDFGGAAINEKISNTLNITLQQADELKRGADNKPQEVSDIISASIKELADLLKQNIISFEMVNKETPKQIFLTGGFSNTQGIEALLQAELNIEFKKLTLGSVIPKGNSDFQSVTAYGIALRTKNAPNISSIDFKSTKTSSLKESKYVFSSLIKVFVMTLILLSFYTADLWIKRQAKKAELENYQRRFSLSFNELFPKIAAKGNELNVIKEEITKTNSQVEKFGALLSKGTTSLDVLNELSVSVAGVGEGGQADLAGSSEIYECEFDGKWLSIVGETQSYNLADEIKKNLEKSEMFGEVNMEYARFTADQKKVKFSMKMALEQK